MLHTHRCRPISSGRVVRAQAPSIYSARVCTSGRLKPPAVSGDPGSILGYFSPNWAPSLPLPAFLPTIQPGSRRLLQCSLLLQNFQCRQIQTEAVEADKAALTLIETPSSSTKSWHRREAATPERGGDGGGGCCCCCCRCPNAAVLGSARLSFQSTLSR